MADTTAALVALARSLRAAGVAATPDRVQAALQAVTELGAQDLYWALRLTLCSSPDDILQLDELMGRPKSTAPAPPSPELPRFAAGGYGGALEPAATERDPMSLSAASRLEVLRALDISDLAPADRDVLAGALRNLTTGGVERRVRRRAPHRTGRVDPHRSVRRVLQAGGEPAALVRSRRRSRRRRLVFIVDVSGSMAPYTDMWLRFAHAASAQARGRGPATELFTLGTRLTRITRAMSHPGADAALRAVALQVQDLAGGTRLGDLMKQFLDEWGQRGLARGAVVVVLSDGWEQGDAALLGGQMARLHRLAHRVVWANPRAGRKGYAPLAAGMAAALPHVDDFVPGHSVAALGQLATLLSGEPSRA